MTDVRRDEDEDSRNDGNEVSAAKPRRHVNWDAVAAIIAALIGLIAILVSTYNAFMVRQQTRAYVWPHLQLAWSGRKPGIVAINSGVGPAIVRSVEVRVDGKPQRDWGEVLKALGFSSGSMEYSQSTLNGRVYASGQPSVVLIFPDKAPYRRFKERATERMDIRICYCSALDDCWGSALGMRIGKVRDVSHATSTCPRVAEADEFHQ